MCYSDFAVGGVFSILLFMYGDKNFLDFVDIDTLIWTLIK